MANSKEPRQWIKDEATWLLSQVYAGKGDTANAIAVLKKSGTPAARDQIEFLEAEMKHKKQSAMKAQAK